MDILPYSIYVDKRPLRVAFLIGPDQLEFVDKVIDYNKDKWGGRFNPIIVTDGQVIDGKEWEFLKEYDPDIIKSLVDLSDELKKKIHIFLSPFSIEATLSKTDYVRLDGYPVSVLPHNTNVRMVSGGFFDDSPTIALFEFDETTPDILRRFIGRNFGYFEDGKMLSYPIKKALEGCQTKTYKITDLVSLNEALVDFGKFHFRVVFANQLCALPNNHQEADYDFKYERFGIVVGDSIDDVVYFWNRVLFLGSWLRTRLTQLWLPTELAEEPTIRPGLKDLLNKYIEFTGNNNHSAHFASRSLAQVDLKKIADSFNGVLRHPKYSEHLDDFQKPKLRNTGGRFFLKSGIESYQAHSLEEHILLKEPDVEQGIMGGENWVADLCVEYRPERFTNHIGRRLWWQFPKRNRALNDLNFFNKTARVNGDKMPSLLMSRSTSFRPDENNLIVKIPDDREVFRSLLLGESYSFVDRDDRARFLSRPYSRMGRSDKGMYLSGVLGLFPDLLNAHLLFEDRFWRTIFEIMSNRDPSKDPIKRTNILNTLIKSIRRGRNFVNSDEDVDWLAGKVLDIVKGESKSEVDLSYTDIFARAKLEQAEFNKQQDSARPLSVSELKEKLSQLIGLNILLIGVKPKCPYCGYRIWYHIDESKQKIVCKGCGYEFSLDAEPMWSYRLNSLVKSAVAAHGTMPVLMVLGQLGVNDAMSSWIYTPSSNLFQKDPVGGKDKLVAELDVACILDGDFIIGEVKQSIGLFGIPDFQKMGDIAELVKPDKVIFSSLDLKPSNFVINQIIQLQSRLKDLHIKVEWYPINKWVFEPHPID